MSDNKSAPKALICGECYERQHKSDLDTNDEYYCEHHQVWAIRRPDGGWLLSTDVSPADHRALVEDARRLQTVDEPVPTELAATSVH